MNNYRQFNADKKAAKKGKVKPNPYKGDVIYGPLGQLANPWKVTKIPGDTMSTSGYGNIPLWTVPDVGEPRMVMPDSGTQYFPGASSFTEYPVQASEGGWLDTYPGGGQIYDRLGRLHSIASYVPGARDGGPTAAKAREMLHDGTAHGKPLTAAQKRYFGYLGYGKNGGEWLDTYQSGGGRKANKVGMFLTNDEVGEYADKGYIPNDISDIDMRRIRMANPKAVVSGLTDHQYFKKGTPEYQYSRYYTPPVPIDPEMYKKLAGVKFDLKKEDKSEWDLIQEKQARKKAEDEYNSLPVTARGEKPLEYVGLETAFLPAARGFGWLGNMAIDAVTGTMRSPIKSLPGSPNTVKQVIKEEMKKVVEQEIDKIPPSFYFNPKPTSVVDMESDYILKNWDKLTNKIPGTTGTNNIGIYNFPEYPDYIAKKELVKNIDHYIPGYMDMNLENMFKDLNNPNLAKVYRSISQEISPERFERTLIMNKIPGKSLVRHTNQALENIDYDAIRKLYEDLKYARSKKFYTDFEGAENILYDPKTNRFGVVDLSVHPGDIDSDWARYVLKDVAYPDIPVSSENLKTAIMDFIKKTGNQYLLPGTEKLSVRPNSELTRKIDSFYDQFRREPIYKSGGQWLDQYQDGKEYKWDFGEIKPTTYYIKGVDDPIPPKTTAPVIHSSPPPVLSTSVKPIDSKGYMWADAKSVPVASFPPGEDRVTKLKRKDIQLQSKIADYENELQKVYYQIGDPTNTSKKDLKKQAIALLTEREKAINEINTIRKDIAGSFDTYIAEKGPAWLSKALQKGIPNEIFGIRLSDSLPENAHIGLVDEVLERSNALPKFDTFAAKREKEKEAELTAKKFNDLDVNKYPFERWRMRATASNNNPLEVFVYGNRSERATSPPNIKAKGTLLHFLDQSPLTGYMHSYTVNAYKNLDPDNYIGVLEDSGKGTQFIKYKKKKDIEGDITKNTFLVRQVPFDEIDFNKKVTDYNFSGHTYWTDKRTGKATIPISSASDENVYNYSSGQSVVYIFPYKGKTRYIHFSGSPAEIRKEGNRINSDYKLKKDELVVGVGDAGSYSSNIRGDISNDKLNNINYGYYNLSDKSGSGAALVDQFIQPVDSVNTTPTRQKRYGGESWLNEYNP